MSLPPLFRRDDRLRIERIPLRRLVVGTADTLDQQDLDLLREMLAQRPEHDHAPLVVRPAGDVFEILDGRKRFIAALAEGRPDVFCLIREEAL